MTQQIKRHGITPVTDAGQRLDQSLARLFPEFSRERLKAWIRSGELTVNGLPARPTQRITGGEAIVLDAVLLAQGEWQAEAMSLPTIFEDDAILVLNKPAGLVVHPAAGNLEGTLLNGLLSSYPFLRSIPRAGIVHRLDKDTSGLMVVAKTLQAQNSLVGQLQARSVSRQYLALVFGHPPDSGVIDAPIARDPHHRIRMAVVDNGKQAITRFEVLQRWSDFSLVRLKLETGRTHQIRVHMTHLGFPLVGDPVYRKGMGGRQQPDTRLATLKQFRRQALHAAELGLVHPVSGCHCAWQCELPDDFSHLLTVLNNSQQR